MNSRRSPRRLAALQALSPANQIIRQIFEINPQIQHAILAGDTASGLLDQRDQLVGDLSELMGIRTSLQSDGRLFVATTDGVQLISDTYAEIDHQPNFGP